MRVFVIVHDNRIGDLYYSLPFYFKKATAISKMKEQVKNLNDPNDEYREISETEYKNNWNSIQIREIDVV